MNLKHINYIHPDKLRTGNNELDKKIGFLLGVVNGNISQLLNKKCINIYN